MPSTGSKKFLKDFHGSVLFVTHDRRFLRAWPPASSRSTAARSPAGPATTPTTSAAAKSASNAQAQETARFDKLLAQEEVWIRQGIKARRTRNEGRVRGLEGDARRALAASRTGGNVRWKRRRRRSPARR